MATTLRQINDFWAMKRLAVVGVSRDPKSFSHAIWQELRDRGYDVVAVNPKAQEIDGKPCYPRVQDVDPPVDGVVVMTPPAVTDQVVQDCAAAGVAHVWLHRGLGGSGSVTPGAVEFCETHGMDVVAGFCPYMFLPESPFFHSFHRVAKRLTGSYPH